MDEDAKTERLFPAQVYNDAVILYTRVQLEMVLKGIMGENESAWNLSRRGKSVGSLLDLRHISRGQAAIMLCQLRESGAVDEVPVDRRPGEGT